jgi:tetratricopeptide (TPR) repeat protein
MKYKTITVLSLLLCFPNAFACINEYRALVDGKIENTSVGESQRLTARFDEKYVLSRLKQADSTYRVTGNLKDFSDYGAALIYAGEYNKALEVFREIERNQPGLYATAANKGTAFELMGELDSALFWIAKAVKINPESHQGSEWIHVKVLEAKVKFKDDESELWDYDVLSLGFGNGKIPENSKNHQLLRLYDQLRFQIMERMFFVKPKDPILAKLLFEFATVIALLENVESAMPVMEQAGEYGLDSRVYKKRKAYFEELHAKADLLNQPQKQTKVSQEEDSTQTVMYTVLILLFVGGLIYIMRKSNAS